MPRGDGTGPLGEGPMTGRAAGYCAGNDAPGFADSLAYGGAARGRGWFRRGFAPGAGYGRGGGRGFRNRFYATGVPFSAYTDPAAGPLMQRDEEVALLKNESTRLKSVLESIEKRLQHLETK
jgi:hypothetical protein